MSKMDTGSDESGNRNREMSVLARGVIEASRSKVDRVIAEFSEDEIVIERISDAPSAERQTFEAYADEGETLLRFHEACNEQEITLDIEQLHRQ